MQDLGSELYVAPCVCATALRERVVKLERIETIAREILAAVKSGVVVRDAEPCKHGNFATAPYNHPKWCDECFFELEDALSQ